MSSCGSLLWLALCCWCCVALIDGKVTFDDDAEENVRPTTPPKVPSTHEDTYCTDRRKTHDETDVDCGGIKCPRCEDMKTCKTNCDCISGTCRDNKCASSMSCEDKIKNQDETDIDCGGILCPKCPAMKTCNGDCDCTSGVCKDNKCVDGCSCKNNGKCIGQNKCSCPTGFRGLSCEIGESQGLCSAKDLTDSEPILSVTFGHGKNQYSSKTPSDFDFTTTYKQISSPSTGGGTFSLINSIYNLPGNIWHTGGKDHTGDEGGYMLLVDADAHPGQFYRGTVKNLCVGRRYEFSVYLANICKPNKLPIKPNVLFQVRTTVGNRLLAEISSGDVLEQNTLTWKKYGLSFVASSDSVVLLMISNASGGSGNDLAIDDIALRVCGEGSGFCLADK